MTAIAAAAGFASSTPTATTWAAFAPAITTDDRLEDLCLTRFLHANRHPPPHQVRGHASWILRPARTPHPPPCRTRPARLSPRAGQPFPVDFVDQGDVVPAD